MTAEKRYALQRFIYTIRNRLDANFINILDLEYFEKAFRKLSQTKE